MAWLDVSRPLCHGVVSSQFGRHPSFIINSSVWLAGGRPIFKATIADALSGQCHCNLATLPAHWSPNKQTTSHKFSQPHIQPSMKCFRIFFTWRSWSFFMATTKPNSSARCFCTCEDDNDVINVNHILCSISFLPPPPHPPTHRHTINNHMDSG